MNFNEDQLITSNQNKMNTSTGEGSHASNPQSCSERLQVAVDMGCYPDNLHANYHYISYPEKFVKFDLKY